MCTRFSYTIPRERLKRQFNIQIREQELQYSYNIGAGDGAYVVTNQSLELQVFRFGFIPDWAQSESVGLNFVNAAAETVATQDTFRMAVRLRRCLVFADGFYEWRRQGLHTQPYRIGYQGGGTMVFAGVWSEWMSANLEVFRTFAILTCAANADVAPFSPRMPVILHDSAQIVRWLSEANLQTSLALLRPLKDGLLHSYPIDPRLDDADYNQPELHNPYQFSDDERERWG